MDSTDLILTTSVATMLQKRADLRQNIAQAFDLLAAARNIEKAITGLSYSTLESFLTSGRGYYFSLRTPQESVDRAMKQLDAQFWAALMNQSGIRAFMNARKQSDFDNMVSNANTPPFEMEYIKATFGDLYEKRQDMMEDGVVEMFHRLSWDYRTNNPVKLGRKIIVNYVLDSWGTANSGTANLLDDLVRILSVYNGDPIPEHRHGMYFQVSSALREHRNVVDTEYFTMKLYKKGTGHIQFKEVVLPLLDQCNRVIARRYPNALPAMQGRAAA